MPKSYSYELIDGERLLSSVKDFLQEGGASWQKLGGLLTEGHVHYEPLRENPMRSGYQFNYKKAKLNLTVYFPIEIFGEFEKALNKDRLLQLKTAFQKALPDKTGYLIHEFKIKAVEPV